ncbi:hypothetical protein BH11BAC7_BH11BAC7_19240 [soil metagenome]
MKHIVRTPTSINAIADALRRELPQYEVEIKQNSLLGFEYVEVRKSSYSGVWVRLKNDKITWNGVVPSAAARVFLGGLILLIATYKSRKQVSTATGEVLMRNF